MHFLREKEYFSRAWQLFGTRSFLEIATDYILIDYILCLKGGDQLTPFFFIFLTETVWLPRKPVAALPQFIVWDANWEIAVNELSRRFEHK